MWKKTQLWDKNDFLWDKKLKFWSKIIIMTSKVIMLGKLRDKKQKLLTKCVKLWD